MWSLIKLVFWAIFWLVTSPFVALFRRLTGKPRLDNCLTWSIRRWNQDDGYLVIRWSRGNKYTWLRWAHFLYLPKDKHQELIHFLPKSHDQDVSVVPDFFFEGKVKKGDDEADGDLEN